MIKTCDSGSMPPMGNSAKFLEGAKRFGLSHKDELSEYFEKGVIESFLDKLRVGIDVPNYPQFRDMNEMFLSMMDGIEKIKEGYLETTVSSLKPDNSQIAEVAAIELNSQLIQEKTGKQFELRVCVTGPYTLASFFPYRDEGTINRLGNIISQIIENSLFSNKHGKTTLVSVDEPLFGLLDDPSIDYGSIGRNNLLNAWETIFSKAKSKNAQTMIHLHSTTNPLFWEAPSLDVIDSHVADPFVRMKQTRELLESRDKFLKASVAVNDFDLLIKERIVACSQEKLVESDVNEKIADTWTGIRNGTVDSDKFLETADTMKSRLIKAVEQFGTERVLYAGPECGFKGYPSYEIALKCLRRISSAVKSSETNHKQTMKSNSIFPE